MDALQCFNWFPNRPPQMCVFMFLNNGDNALLWVGPTRPPRVAAGRKTIVVVRCTMCVLISYQIETIHCFD